MALSVCEKASNNCVKSDPQFINKVGKSMPENVTEKVEKLIETDSKTGEIDSKSNSFFF